MNTEKRRGRPPFPSTANALARYMAERRITRTAAAEALGVTRANITSIVLGKSRPSAALMSRIETWTSGAVTMRSWFADDGNVEEVIALSNESE